MAERLFLFVQMEFPWELGPADGRYVLRGDASDRPEHVVVLDTVGAARRRALGSRVRKPEANPEPAAVPTARATVIDPVSLSAESQARAWLDGLDAEHETSAAAAVLNGVLFAHRIARADPYLREVSPAQALVIRAGWGVGEQVAGGRWAHARELLWREPRARQRSAALRPQERLAVLLGGRETPLLCEEYTLRARLDLDSGRIAHAAIALDLAHRTAILELEAEGRVDLAARIEELRQLRGAVEQLAQDALSSSLDRSAATPQLDEEVLHHALGRLEAALRARTATGWHQSH